YTTLFRSSTPTDFSSIRSIVGMISTIAKKLANKITAPTEWSLISTRIYPSTSNNVNGIKYAPNLPIVSRKLKSLVASFKTIKVIATDNAIMMAIFKNGHKNPSVNGMEVDVVSSKKSPNPPNRSRTELPKLFAAKKYPKANTRAYITIVITLEIQSFLFACFAADGFLSKVMKKLLKLLLTSLIFSTASFGAAWGVAWVSCCWV